MKHGRYILIGKEPALVEDLATWAHWYQHAKRTVAKTELGYAIVSTVFLGLDHSFGYDRNSVYPILFETMIFGGRRDQYQWRCSTWEEAEAQHAGAVALLKREETRWDYLCGRFTIIRAITRRATLLASGLSMRASRLRNALRIKW